MTFDIQAIRSQFPSLAIADGGRPRIYFDNPGGTQVPRQVIDRTVEYFTRHNANSGGYFATTVATDAILADAHLAAAEFVNAAGREEIAFGQNMTTLTLNVSRSIAKLLKPGDELIVTRMDHEANVSPWLLVAEDLGLTVKWLAFDPETFEYNLDCLETLLTPRTRLVAVNYASNALGTINDVQRICSAARAVGAMSYVDAVQFAPHGAIDVQAIGCDFLAFSAYKVFGPHLGVLWGRREIVEKLDAYKVRPASNHGAERFETGTLSHEAIAGLLGAFDYLAWVGDTMFPDLKPAQAGSPRQAAMSAAMDGLFAYEKTLTQRLIAGLKSMPAVTVCGLTADEAMDRRVPTVSVKIEGRNPAKLAKRLADENIFVWNGHNYAVEAIRSLGLYDLGGVLRIGLAHYNTPEEVDILLSVLRRELLRNDD
ncbi:cysteine desulfurase-like protein [Pseudaminobacter sp. 19-2017]|uniref:Cysteine desulfurase-like protein n=1 Tax=Pseudaminobacter soli (ex Zhang et al. 2022) TaxID=2831468 RepID=A0A942DWS9_9HYPH|nr:cysteine desulfurase-like protein [Pseudaminobacter soli]MBS3649299.1 cysteine desulfurase-like protein [Pseudaminobacter soli]